MCLAMPLAMTGCAMPNDPPNHPALASKPCVSIAQARATDAAENDIEPDMQQVIFRDSYNDCVRWQDKAVLHDVFRANAAR